MRFATSVATIALLSFPAFAQSQPQPQPQPQVSSSKSEKMSCSQLQSEMRNEVRQLNLDQAVQDRVDNLFRQASQASNDEQCLRALRQANSTISRETGEAPISSARLRQAFQDARPSQASSKETGDQRAKSTKKMSESDAARISVAFSNILIGRAVQDNRGDTAGELEYLAVDTATGDIRFAVIGSGGLLDLGEELTAVPWDNVNVHTGGATSEPRIRLDASLDQLKQSRRITQDRLDLLTSPRFQTQIMTYYVPFAINSDRTADRTAQNRSQERGQARPSQSDRNEERTAEARARDGGQPTEDRTAQGKSADKQQGADRAGQDPTLMLVGRELITTVSSSQLRTGQQIRGATVETSDGREVGEIDRLVIDIDRGKIAYALVAKGGFLGIGEEWRPVPLTALNWQSGGVYTLDQGQGQLEKMPKLTSDTLPSRIRQGDLKKLYQAYGADPYWTQAKGSSERKASQN